jgi:hypothetical protein
VGRLPPRDGEALLDDAFGAVRKEAGAEKLRLLRERPGVGCNSGTLEEWEPGPG